MSDVWEFQVAKAVPTQSPIVWLFDEVELLRDRVLQLEEFNRRAMALGEESRFPSSRSSLDATETVKPKRVRKAAK
jgi:hypothetical protein